MATNDDRMHMRLPTALKEQMLEYARKRNTTLTAITVKYYTELLEDDRRKQLPQDAEQV